MSVTPVGGLHHITAIAGPAQENLDFYAGVLGMRLVKKSVNQDDPGTYHLFYADGEGHPGTDLTFFPWSHMAPPRVGHGLSVEVSLTVPPGSLEFWGQRLTRYGVKLDPIEVRFGRRTLPLGGSPWSSRGAGRSARCVDADICAVGRQPDRRRAPGPRPRELATVGAQPRAHLLVPDRRPRLPAGRHRGRLASLCGGRGGTGRVSWTCVRSTRHAPRGVGRRQHSPSRMARGRSRPSNWPCARRSTARVAGRHR